MGIKYVGSKSARLKAMAATAILASSLVINGMTPKYAHSAEVDENARYEELLKEAKQGEMDNSVSITTVQGQELEEVTFENFKNMYLHDMRPSKETLKLMFDEDYGVIGYSNPSMNSIETDPYQILLAEMLRENNKINSNKGKDFIEMKNKVSEIRKKQKELNTRKAITVVKRANESIEHTQEEVEDMFKIKTKLNSTGDKFQQQEMIENLLKAEWEKLLNPSFISLTSTQDILKCQNLRNYLESNLYEKDMNPDELAKFAIDYKKTIRANIEILKEKQKLRDNSVIYQETLKGISNITYKINDIRENFSGTYEEKNREIESFELERALKRAELEYLDRKLGVEAIEIAYTKDPSLVDKYEAEVSMKTTDLELKKKLNAITEKPKNKQIHEKDLGEER